MLIFRPKNGKCLMNIVNKDEEVKKEIIEAAKVVFQKWGLKKTTMEDIAKEAGKGKSTLYYYFKSKEEIFEMLAKAEINNILYKSKNLHQVDGQFFRHL